MIDVDPDDVAINKLRGGYVPKPGEVVIERVFLRGGTHQVPCRFDLINKPAAGQLGWRMAIAVHDGMPLCVRLTFETSRPGSEIKNADLRNLRVDDLVELATASVAIPAAVDENGQVRTLPITYEEVRSGKNRPAVRHARRQAHRRVADDTLREVARVYRLHPGPDRTRAVQRHFDLAAERTARDWVHRAREAGFLGRGIQGKAGEVPLDWPEQRLVAVQADPMETSQQ